MSTQANMSSQVKERKFDIYKFLLTIPGILIAYSVIFLAFFVTKAISPEGNNPILLAVGPLTFRWYGVLITLGVIIALYMAMYLAERRGEDPDKAWIILPIVLVTGVAGARLWYVVNTWDKYKNHIFNFGDPNNPGVFEVWNGGIAIQGAVVGGALGLFIYKFFSGIKFARWGDFIVVGVIVAQSLGRWGNFMNNEAYGRKTDLPWGIKIPCEFRTRSSIPGADDTACTSPGFSPDDKFHPTFFYESVWNYAVFLTLLFATIYPKKVERAIKIRLRDGDIVCAYLVLYSIGRFFVESLRTDSLFIIGDPVNGGIRSAQLISIISILLGAFILIYRHATTRTADDEALSVRVRLRQKLAVATAGADMMESGAVADEVETAEPEGAEEADTDEEVDEAVNELEEAELDEPVDTDVSDLDEEDEPKPPSGIPHLEQGETQLLSNKLSPNSKDNVSES